MAIISSEIVNGLLVNAISAVGRMLVGSASSLRLRRVATDLDIARWFDTYQLIGDGPPFAQGLSADAAEQVEAGLGHGETQAVLQELLAARLTDAPEAEISRIRTAWDLSFAHYGSLTLAAEHSEAIFDYYDEKIGELVVRLEAAAPATLAGIRADAFSTRLIDVLNAIERHTAALSSRPNGRTEASFLTSYRRHVVDQHGKLDPPDFERRRRIPISDIYVSTGITEDVPPEPTMTTRLPDLPSLTVFDLAGRLDRTVLLGDPGGGKTTATTVLMHRFGGDTAGRVPFLVTLREYAANDPPERSVVGHIEHTLATFYQCPAPAGLVDLLLLTGRAVVIFDGLDELLDTSRRADVTTRVERFCAEYPHSPVLVTSRAVGYDQAKLDDHQFTSFRLGSFGEDQVAEYARKWFAQDPDAHPGDAEAFLTESASVSDLRSNPLLLSLMCILYRGEGSLPRDRAGIYEQCTNLLLRRWDAWRRIHNELRAGHLVERALRHLAWWLFTRDETQAAVTERELVAETTKFLHTRGFESEDDARSAAREFVEFCRGRAWVFSDAGTTAMGERLYAFTHRTFLEYFAAAHLAYDSDSPERLARTLAPHVARGQWEVVGELAVQIKDTTSSSGARRVYAELLGDRRRRSPKGRGSVLQFLARSLRSVDPSPQTVRIVTQEVMDFLLSGDRNSYICGLPLAWLLASCNASRTIVYREISTVIAAMVTSDDPAGHLDGLRLAASLDVPLRGNWGGRGPELLYDNPVRRFWMDRTEEIIRTHENAIMAAAVNHADMRCIAVNNNVITVKQAVDMPDALLPLMQKHATGFFRDTLGAPLMFRVYELVTSLTEPSRTDSLTRVVSDFTAIGQYLSNHPQLPWITGKADGWSHYSWDLQVSADAGRPVLSPIAYLGFAGVVLMSVEFDESLLAGMLPVGPSRLGPFDELEAYIEHRLYAGESLLPDLPLPDEFKQVLRDWAAGKVNFTAPGND